MDLYRGGFPVTTTFQERTNDQTQTTKLVTEVVLLGRVAPRPAK